MTLTHSTPDLRRFPVFARLPRRARAVVGSLTTLVSFSEGRVICREGELGREAFVLVSGTAAVSRDGAPVAVLAAGEVVGEGALLGDGRRNATVTATSDVTALVMSVREFHTLMTLPGVDEAIRGLQNSRDVA